MMGDWIIAPILIPAVLAGGIVLFARKSLNLQRAVALGGVLALCAVAVALLAASAAGTEVYHLGNWPAPFGIMLALDRLSALMLGLVAVLSLVVLIYAIATGWDARGRHFHALYLFQLMGLNGAFLTGDAFNLFVFFEVLLIASYGLMIHGSGAARLRAGVQYVAFNLVGSTLFLFALGTLYAVTGTLNMADLAVKLPALPQGDQALLRVAAVLLLLVFAIKGALVPLQFWLPGTYANAPGPVAALFAVMTKVGAYAAIRFGTLVFPADLAATGALWETLLFPAALATMVVGALGVLGARSLARMAAFAAIGSMGMVFLAVSGGTSQSLTAGLYYMVHSTLAGAALFLVTDLILTRRGTAQGRFAQDGMLSALYMAVAVAAAGMPPLSGFVGKLLILQSFEGREALVWSVVLLSSLGTIIGFARQGSVLFWTPSSDAAPAPGPAQPAAFAAVALLLVALAGLTLGAGPAVAWLTTTAEVLYAPAAHILAHDLPGGM